MTYYSLVFSQKRSRRQATAGLLTISAGLIFGPRGVVSPASPIENSFAARTGSVLASPVPGTPAARAANLITVRLEPGLSNDWCFYNGRSNAPSGEHARTAAISGIRNTTNKRIALNYWDPSGKRIGPVSINMAETSRAFNGQNVAGFWEAAVSGSEADAPAHVVLEITYELSA